MKKVTTAKSKQNLKNIAQLKKSFLDVASVVEMEEIPPDLILNWDQTGIKLVPSSFGQWTARVLNEWKLLEHWIKG